MSSALGGPSRLCPKGKSSGAQDSAGLWAGTSSGGVREDSVKDHRPCTAPSPSTWALGGKFRSGSSSLPNRGLRPGSGLCCLPLFMPQG